MQPEKVEIMGMTLDQWGFKSCTAHFGVGDDYATLYRIVSKEEGKGHATGLLRMAKEYYEKQGKKVGGTVALHPAISKIYKKLNYIEYDD